MKKSTAIFSLPDLVKLGILSYHTYPFFRKFLKVGADLKDGICCGKWKEGMHMGGSIPLIQMETDNVLVYMAFEARWIFQAVRRPHSHFQVGVRRIVL